MLGAHSRKGVSSMGFRLRSWPGRDDAKVLEEGFCIILRQADALHNILWWQSSAATTGFASVC
jgi:hypothetical protein